MHHNLAIKLSMAVLAVVAMSACGAPGEWPEQWAEGQGGERTPFTCGSGVTPATPYFDANIDGYAAYEGQSTCDPTAKPGVVAFRDLVLATYPCTSDSGITRSCGTGGKSEHKEGRAWDWGLNFPHPAADALLQWLLATDQHGNQHAMARRLGIMYMIWNNKIWKSYQASKGWQTYTGSNPHTDHVHFSFSWAGANKQTSFWTAGTTPPPPTPPTPPPPPPASNTPPNGWLQTADCQGITGWAQDPDGKTATVDVRIYIDGAPPIVAKANVSRQDLCTQLGSCHHGYDVTVPLQYRDGKPHTIRVEAVDLGNGPAGALKGSPRTFSCSQNTNQPPAPNPPDTDLGDDLVDPDGPTGSSGGGLPATPSGPGPHNGETLGGGCSMAGSPAAGSELLLVGLLLLGLHRRRR